MVLIDLFHLLQFSSLSWYKTLGGDLENLKIISYILLLIIRVYVSAQLSLIPCDPMDYSLSGS